MSFDSDEYNKFPIKKFESMLKTNHILFFDSDEFEDIVTHYLENGKIALAKKATNLGLQQHPSSTNLKLYQIEMYIFENKLDLAEELLNELHLFEQGNEEVHIQKANIYSRRNNHKMAIKYLERALEITDNATDVLSLIGMEYLFMEDYENGMHFFIRCLEEDPSDHSALYNIIYCYEFLDQQAEAIEFLKNYLEKNPYSDVAWHQLGKEFIKTKEYQKALDAFDFAIISDDTFIGAYLEKGRVLEKMKRYGKAIQCYLITLGLDDPTSYALLRIGKCHEKLNHTDLALQYYLKCIKEDSLLDKGWLAITDFFFRDKQYHKALYYIKKALTIDTENPQFWKRYARINYQLDLLEEAEVGYRKTLELGNYELDSWIPRGDILTELGEYEAGVNNFNQALEFYPEHPEIEYRLSGLYFSLRESEKGAYYLRNALRNDPELLTILEEIFPLVLKMKKVKQIVAEHKNPSS